MEGGLLAEKNCEKKSRNAKKTERGYPLVSPGSVCYAEKQEKHFWFSSQGQLIQLFWSVQVD